MRLPRARGREIRSDPPASRSGYSVYFPYDRRFRQTSQRFIIEFVGVPYRIRTRVAAVRGATAACAEGRPIAQSAAEAPEDIGAGNGAPAGAAGDPVAAALDELIAAHQATHGDFADTSAV
jgi:hypothetical protein